VSLARVRRSPPQQTSAPQASELPDLQSTIVFMQVSGAQQCESHPSREQAKKLAAFFNVPVDFFI
jgi:hypothetical protein